MDTSFDFVLDNRTKFPKMTEIYHAMPCFGKEHKADCFCWCQPDCIYRNNETGAEFWVHHEDN